MTSEIRFCLPVGKWWFLSPYAKFPIEMNVDGNLCTFSSAEHYYQAMKFYASYEHFNVIKSMENPDEARDDILPCFIFPNKWRFFCIC